jgi:hypothetical protein
MTADRRAAPVVLPAALLAAALGAAAPAAAQETGIGSVAAANEDVLGTPPARERRALRLGAGLVSNERVETTEIGAGQFLFLDQTSLTVWPNSDIVLDAYVYDPATATGTMALSVTKGALRFIGGRISKGADVTVATPQASIAVRGGIAQIAVTPERTLALHVAGEYTRVAGLVLSRANALAEVRAGETEARFLGIADAETVRNLYRQPPGEGDGGLPAPPDGETVAGLVEGLVAPLGSEDDGASNRRPVSTFGEEETDALPAPALALLTDATDSRLQASQPGRDVGEPPPPPRPPLPPPDPTLTVTPLPGFAGTLFAATGQAAQDGFVVGGTATALSAFNRLAFAVPVPDEEDPDAGDPDAGDPGAGDPGAGDAVEIVTYVIAEGTADPSRYVLSEGFTAETNPFARLFDVDTGGLLIPLPGFGLLDGRVADVDFFADQGVFYLAGFEAADGGPAQSALYAFGAPTPAAYWRDPAPGGGPLVVQAYDISSALFTGVDAPLPPLPEFAPFAVSLSGGGGVGLVLVSDPAGGFVGDPAAGTGAATPTEGRALAAYLNLTGRGADQRSAFGAFTAPVQATPSGAPSFMLEGLTSAQFTPVANVALAETRFGTVPLGGGGATGFGAQGDYLVVSSGGQFADDADPDFDPVANVLRHAGPELPAATPYGDTRLATVSGRDELDPAARTPLATETRPSAAAEPSLTSFLTGGYAVAGFDAANPSGPTGPRGILLGATSGSVRIGFSPQTNSVAAEMTLDAVVGDEESFAFNFGDFDDGAGAEGRGAMVNDRLFALRETAGVSTGAITGQVQGAVGDFGEADLAFRGGMASRDLTGDGGLFPAGTDTDPENLRWGWWNADATPEIASGFDDLSYRMHLGAWVSGVLQDIATVQALSGSASYDGFALAQVVARDGNGVTVGTYLEGGRFLLDYDFDDRVGFVTLEGFLGQDFFGEVFGQSGGEHYRTSGFALDGSAGGSGLLQGSFFAGTGLLPGAAATAGAFELTGASPFGGGASAAGVFGADLVDYVPPPPPPPPLTVTPLTPNFEGALFAAAGSQAVQGLIAAQPPQLLTALNRLTFRTFDAGGAVLTENFRVIGEATATPARYVDSPITTLDTVEAFARFDEVGTAGLLFGPFGGFLDGSLATTERFAAPGLFYAATAFDPQSGTDQSALAVFGSLTGEFYWRRDDADGVRVATYGLTDALFGGPADFLPPSFGDVLGFGESGLTLVSDPSGGFVNAPALGAGPATVSAGKAFDVAFAIGGAGPNQVSFFGVLTGPILVTAAGQPSPQIEGLMTGSLNGFDQLRNRLSFGALGVGALGVLSDLGPATSFGPLGEFLVLSSGGLFADGVNDPAFDTRQNRFSITNELGPDQLLDLYGDTRIASAPALEIVGTARTPLAVPTPPQFSTSADARVERMLTGGVAAAAGRSFAPSFGGFTDPFLLTAPRQQSVLVGFSTATNGVVAELRGLDDIAGDGAITNANFNFGGFDGRGAMISDQRFAAREAEAQTGDLTGQLGSVAGRAGIPPVGGVQQAFEGGIAEAGATGDGGIFPAGTDTRPEHLRWGWWNGEFEFAAAPSDPLYDGRVAQVDLGSWVGGVLTDISVVEGLSGVATYDGFAVAHVVENVLSGGDPRAYVDGGRFRMEYDFSDRVGEISLTDIAGEPLLRAAVDGVSAGDHHFVSSAGLTGFANGGGGSISGSFYGGADPRLPDASAAAGAFSFGTSTVDGRAVAASGVYGGDLDTYTPP